MPRLTAEQAQLREQIRLLSALLKTERAEARATKRVEKLAAEAAKPKRLPHITRALGRLTSLLNKARADQAEMALYPKFSMAACHLDVYVVPGLATLIRDYASSLADEIGPELIAWAAAYFIPTRRTACPLPDLTTRTKQTP